MNHWVFFSLWVGRRVWPLGTGIQSRHVHHSWVHLPLLKYFVAMGGKTTNLFVSLRWEYTTKSASRKEF